VRPTDPLEATITVGPVNLRDHTVALEAGLQITFPMPDHDEHLPEQIEAYVHQAGLQLQRRLFQLLIEKADRDLVFHRRHGKAGQGIQRRGTRPYTFNSSSTPQCSIFSSGKDLTHQSGGVAPGAASRSGVVGEIC
jgi:hypothetical protein